MNDISRIVGEFGDISQWQTGPDFWLSKPHVALPFIESLKQATVRNIGTTAGGRELLAIEYGEKEPLDATCDNFIAALASHHPYPPNPTDIYPPHFYGTKRREKPVIVLESAVHGGEMTGTVACLNLCHIIETGEDLRGKAWPMLRDLALQTRLVIVPWLNRDGAERCPLVCTSGVPAELDQRCTQGIASDGTKHVYPQVKKIFPIPPDKTAFMGTYYNDHGVNLTLDYFQVERQPETRAWMKYYLSERPDAVVFFHCNAGSMIGSSGPSSGHATEVSRLAGAVHHRLIREGIPYRPATRRMSVEGAPKRPGFGQGSAIYYTTGATPILCELPNGAREYYFTPEQMLDMGLFMLEETLLYAHTSGLRPYEHWDKIKLQRETQTV